VCGFGCCVVCVVCGVVSSVVVWVLSVVCICVVCVGGGCGFGSPIREQDGNASLFFYETINLSSCWKRFRIRPKPMGALSPEEVIHRVSSVLD